MGNINLTPIFQALIALLAALITYKLIPWIQSRTTEQQQSNLSTLIRVLVFAAEQIYGAGNGKEKLEYVCAELRERGYEVDLSEIEAAVYAAFNYDVPILRPLHDNAPKTDEAETDEGEDRPEEQEETEPEIGRVTDQPPDAAAESRE